jgi:DNA polymerase-3 subunit delta'
LNLVFPLPRISNSKGIDDPIKNIGKDDYESILQMIDLKSKDPFVKINLPSARRIIINSIRFLRKILYLKSQNNGRKIVIIFDAHLMSEGAGESANALLKILEEPPDNTSLILVTDKKSKLPLTIVSRCQQIDFSSLAFEKVRELIENDQVSNDRATQLAMLSNGNMHLANQLTLYDVSQPLEEAHDIIESFTMLDESKWRNSINSFSMLAFRKPEEFVFKMCLIQMWMNLASKFKYGKNEADFFNENFNTFEEFNNKYPNADFFEINNLFESSILALNQNLYMPLFIIDMIISMQTLLKGEKPKIII